MRTKLLADRAAGNDSAFQKFLAERKEQDGEKKNGFFSNMGKFVAKRWKELVGQVRMTLSVDSLLPGFISRFFSPLLFY